MSLFRKLLLIAAILGFFLPWPGVLLKEYLAPTLAISIFFSLIASNDEQRLALDGVKNGLIYNYGFNSGSLILLSLFAPSGIKEGLIMYAIAPPSAGTSAISAQWGGDPKGVVAFQILSYIASIVFMPIAALLLLGSSIDATIIAVQLIIIFVIPLIVSRFVKIDKKKKGLMLEISGVFLALSFYSVISISSSWIVANISEVAAWTFLMCAITCVVSYIAYRASGKKPDAVIYAMEKNGGAAAAMAIIVLSETSVGIISIKALINALLIVIIGKFLVKK
ncbi:hypothetical protein KJ780_04955 [Candidatus Micrarchaeota archaeon]|nr:hypothetical protein [Candidatus Micrarchaeota archaeon]